jgi:hypothetical protein
VLVLPSYSTAKSIFGALALMRLEKLYPGAKDQKVADYIPECAANGHWGDVTFLNALDMATGNFGSAKFEVDEDADHTTGLFLQDDHAAKIRYSCHQYKRRAKPGSTWVYHTSDTYILGTALNSYLAKTAGPGLDIYNDVMIKDVWKGLGLSPLLATTRRTYDKVGHPFTGWGLVYHGDDIARIAIFLESPKAEALFDNGLLNAALQRDSGNRGLPAGFPGIRYQLGFWARDVKPVTGCANPTWVPFMSGWGGISVALMPNKTVYYAFSDGQTYNWGEAASESNRIRGYCS